MEDEIYVPGQLTEQEVEQEAKPAQPVYPAPFGYKFGNSSVDLSIEDNHTTMKDEYDGWWNAKGEDRDSKQQKFNQKYFGMSTEEVRAEQRKTATSMYGSNTPLSILEMLLY